MEWSLTKAEPEIPVQNVDTSLDEHLRQNLVMTSLEDMLAWGRKHSVWPSNPGSVVLEHSRHCGLVANTVQVVMESQERCWKLGRNLTGDQTFQLCRFGFSKHK